MRGKEKGLPADCAGMDGRRVGRDEEQQEDGHRVRLDGGVGLARQQGALAGSDRLAADPRVATYGVHVGIAAGV